MLQPIRSQYLRQIAVSRCTTFALIAWLAVAGILATAETAVADEYWCAVSICPTCHQMFWATKYPDARQAARSVLERPLLNGSHAGHGTARLLLNTRAPYVAIAWSPMGAYGYAPADSREQAVAEARRQCLKNSMIVSKIQVLKNNDYEEDVLIVDPINPER